MIAESNKSRRFGFVGICAISMPLICAACTATQSDPESAIHNPQSTIPAGAGPADLILHNGYIWTVSDENPTAQALAVRDGRFSVVGSNEEILKQRGHRTRVVDLRGRFVLPGFIDSHVHFASAARFLEFNIMTTTRQAEFVKRVNEVAAALPQGEWILGGYWGAYDRWVPGTAGSAAREAFTPDMRLIEAITSDHPMFIQKFDNSTYAANSTALKALGLNPDNPSAAGLEFVRDRDGRLTGLIRGENVRSLFAGKIPKRFSHRRRMRQTQRALKEIARYGVTSVSDMSDDEQLEIYRELLRAGRLTVRIRFRYGLDRWKECAQRGIKVGSGDEWIRLGVLKGHIDGIMGTSTARFFEPYEQDPTNRGRWRRLMLDEKGNFVEGKFLRYMFDADRAGLQLSVHAIGDQANHLLLDFVAALQRRNGKRDRRFRLVHAQVLAPTDFKRLGKLGVLAEVQPYHLSDDMRWMEERLGWKRCRGAYAFAAIRDSGAILCFGSDWPGTSASAYPINPMLGLHAAVTRQTLTGQPPDGWYSKQRISIEEAIKAYTYNNAYASFEEDIKGSIEVGKLADLVVLSQNLLAIKPNAILDTRVLYTIIGGKIVYQGT